MSKAIAPLAVQRFFDNNGDPLAFGKLYTYIAGSAGALNKATYSTPGGAVNSNPILLNDRGEADIWMDTDTGYLLTLKDKDGNLIWSRDNIRPSDQSDIIDALVSLGDFDTIAVSTALGITSINRRIRLTGAGCALNLPAVGVANIGDAVLIEIDAGATGVFSIQGAVGANQYIDGASERIMAPGEWAFITISPAVQWTKIFGRSIPFTGSIENTAAIVGVPIGPWTRIPLTLAGGNTDQNLGVPGTFRPWFSVDKIKIPRRGSYHLALQMHFGNIAMPAPNYMAGAAIGAPTGTESGATIEAGIGSGNGVDADPSGSGYLNLGRVLYNESLRTIQWSGQELLGKNVWLSAYARPLAPLTGVDISFTANTVVTRLSFTEIITW